MNIVSSVKNYYYSEKNGFNKVRIARDATAVLALATLAVLQSTGRIDVVSGARNVAGSLNARIWKMVGMGTGAVGTVAVLGYGAKKAYPKVAQAIQNFRSKPEAKVQKNNNVDDPNKKDDEDDTVKE